MWAKVRCSEREGLLTAVSAGKTELCKCTLAIRDCGLFNVVVLHSKTKHNGSYCTC